MKISDMDLWKSNAGHILVTTNSYVKRDNCLVMGRGAALQAMVKYPEFPKVAGRYIKEQCGHLGKYGICLDLVENVGIFQVKYHFKDKGNLELIEFSTKALFSMAKNFPFKTFALNFPGIGYGQLSEQEVLPIVSRLPDNVTIHKIKI